MDAQAIVQELTEHTDKTVFGVWFMIAVALVFFMQAGFAMVETGFTRAKNAGNIIMKNLMDFCIGTVVFILIGFGLMFGEDLVGFIGKPGFDIFTSYGNFEWVKVRIQPCILCHYRNDRFGCYGRKNKVPFLLRILSDYQRTLSILSRLTGSGAAAGWHSWASMIFQVHVQSIW